MQSMIATPQQLSKLLGHVSRQMNLQASGDLFRVLAELDLSFTQCKALMMIDEAGELAVKDVAAALSLSLPAASRAVEGLVQRGMLERRECAADRRSRLVALRPEGHRALQAVTESRLASLEAFAATLTDEERAGLHAALLPIVERTQRR